MKTLFNIHRVKLFIFLLLIIFLSGIGNSYAQYKHKRGQLLSTRTDFVFTTSDGTRLDATKFIPDGTPPAGGFPALIICHGYGGTKEETMPYAEEMALEGYYTLTYSMRGQGFSTGLSNLISTTEMDDFVQIMNYVKSLPNINVNKVGAVGGSQGGIIPYMAACNYPGSLRCVVSDVSIPDFATNWIENNSVKMTLLWTLSYDTSIVRYNNQLKAYRNWMLSSSPDKFDSLLAYLPGNRDFMNKVAQNTTPIIISNVWQDKFFSVQSSIRSLQYLTSTYRLYIGTYYAHGADYDIGEDDYHSQITQDWIDYWLGGFNNGATDSSKFVYASSSYPRSTDGWTWSRSYSTVWPPAGTDNITFYLRPDGKLRTVTNNNFLPDTLGFVNDVKDPAITMTEAVNYEFTGTTFNSRFVKSQIVFETPPLVQNTKMVGAPYVNIHYSSTGTEAQFNFQIYEIKSGTTPYIVGRANFTDRKITPNTIRQISFYGTPHSHIFQAGSKIRIVLTNLDNISNDPFLRTNPYVLPSLVKGRSKIYMNTANPTYVQLPLIDYIPNAITPISSEIPSKFELTQNYPNPFNPSTTIKFNIPKNAAGQVVTLKVYDMQGRLISELVNGELKAGSYEVKFDGTGLATGTYFYRLTAGNLTDTKKLVLVK